MKKIKQYLNVVAHAYKPSTEEDEAGELSQIVCKLFCNFLKTVSHVIQSNLKLLVFLSSPLKCYDYKHVLSFLGGSSELLIGSS